MDDATLIDVPGLARELKLRTEQIENVIQLLDDGNTIPFITRYRKEQTGNLNEELLLAIESRVASLRQVAERARAILRLIEAQGQLTPKLKKQILAADSLKRLEDLYLPYRPKRRSRATTARERGLAPLADQIWDRDPSLTDLNTAAAEFVDPEKELPDADAVLAGASDILAERISENADVRESARKIAKQTGRLAVAATKTGKESGQDYQDYFDYSDAITKVPPHRALAINRGEKAGMLRVRFQWDADAASMKVTEQLDVAHHPHREFLTTAIDDALTRLILPSLDRELRRELTERAEEHAISVFAKNLRSLLLQPPLRGQRVLAVDPGFRTGCKLAVLDEQGHRLLGDVVYVTGSAEKRQAARDKLAQIVVEHNCQIVAIGNGTACRETEELVTEVIADSHPDLRYLIVNEAGASIYSTSAVARDEFPDFDATERGTISIGRRLQDPLSELVKIEPQHIGVGMYQHDVAPKRLKESLDQVVESCVNFVGVDLNTSSASLLRHVSGLNQLIARRVVEWRDKHGGFQNRRQLRDVPGIGETTFTQAAGFLRVDDGDEPLDATWIHPESYDAARGLLSRTGIEVTDFRSDPDGVRSRLDGLDRAALAHEIGVGEPTLADIIDALGRPGRDPRSDSPGPVFKQGVLKLEDLSEGLELQGTVLNVVDFGAFVDIGLKESALVHISQMATRYINSPLDVVSVGDVIQVWVTKIDPERRRVSLTMLNPNAPVETHPKPKQSRPKPTPHTESKGKNQTGKPKQRSKPPKPKKQPSKLSDDQRQGQAPLAGFDQLKELWQDRR